MFRKKREQADFSAEIQAHIELEADRLREQGMNAAAALAAARRTFGNTTSSEERYYETGRWAWLDRIAQNARFGIRVLAKNPASSLIAILTLAFGIGATTSIFSLLNAVLLKTLPVDHPGDLVLFGRGNWNGSVTALPDNKWDLFSYDGFHQFRARNTVFEDVAAIDSILATTHARIASSSNLEELAVELVSGSYFHTLRVNPAAGRVLHAGDDVTPGGHPVAVASYSWWQRRMGGAPSTVGTTVMVGSTTYSIVGVAQSGFTGITGGQSPDVWVPLAMEKEISPGWNGLDDKLFQSLYLFARRKPGVTIGQANANVNLLFHQIVLDYAAIGARPESAGPNGPAKIMDAVGRASVELNPLARGMSQLRRRFSTPLIILMSVVVLVLMIACANVANLLLARASARHREIAVRMSIGAGRTRLIQQLLTESAILGLAGATLSVPLGWALLRFLVSAGPGSLAVAVPLDWSVLGFGLALTMLTVLLFGTAPALRTTRVDLASSLRNRGIAGSTQGNLLSRALVVGQVALSLTLLTGAGLFLRSLANLMSVPTGFDTKNVLATSIDPNGAGYHVDARLAGMMQGVEDRVSAVPGVEGSSFVFSLLSGGGWTSPVLVPGRPASDLDPFVFHNAVGARYLPTMNIPIIAGRGFNERDNQGSRKVAVINETMARTYFPGVFPVGRTFSIGHDAEWQDIEVVGVMRDGKYMNLTETPQPAAFYPRLQHAGFLYSLVTRYRGDSKLIIPQIRKAIAEVDPALPVGKFSTLDDMVRGSVSNRRVVAQLSALFGVLAALLACIGIYGVMSYGITRRTNEFGIRMALGAPRGRVLWMVLRETLSLMTLGIAAGLALSLFLSRLVTSMLFGLEPNDPLAIGAATLVMAGVALFAGWLPARRATRIDPLAALRYE